MSPDEKRVAERVHVQLPLHIGQEESVTRDVSRAGIYFLSEGLFAKGKTLKLSLSFDYTLPGEPIRLSCLGEVVRVEAHASKFGIAAKIKDLKFIN
jgi:hypothetical protein